DILAKTENIKNALENAKNMKSERDAVKIELQNKITEAEALLVKLASANIEQNIRDNLRKQIDFAKGALTDLSKDGILLAKNNLDIEINKSLQALRNKLRELIENTKTLQTKVNVYRDQGLEVESNRLATLLEKVQPNIDTIDENELLNRINQIISINGDVNRVYNEWYPLKVDMVAQINTLEKIIAEMKKQPNLHSKYIQEAEGKLVGWKSLKTISQLSNGLWQIKSYIPALNKVKNQYENAYTNYVNSKTNAQQLRKLLETNNSYVSDFDNRVLNAAKVYEDKFLSGPNTNVLTNLTEGKKILDTSLAVYKEKLKLEQDKITTLINGGVAQNAQKVKTFSTVTNSTKAEHKNIALDNIAINQRNDLSSKYANIRPEDNLNSLVIRIDSSNKPSVQEFMELNRKLTELTKADSIINKILDDNWTRNGDKWLYTLAKNELQKAFDYNLKNNADSGSVDKKVLDLSRTEAWTYNGTDKSKYSTYTRQFQTLTNEYKELTRVGSLNYNRTQANIANSLRITNNNLVGNWVKLKDTMQYWEDGYFREPQINHNDFNTITRSIGASNGEMVYEDLLQARLRTKTSLVESFLRLETLRSMQNFMNYWNNFGGYKYQNPLIKGNADYNVLKGYVYKFYRYQTKGTSDLKVHLWTQRAKNRYWNQGGNFNYEIRTLERDHFNSDGEVGILDYARRNWGGTL
ncbi:synaptonemal complex protein 1, partial [Mycoplasmopsis anatis]